MKIKWKVAPAPTGPYRSFEMRSWPTGYDSEGEVIASLHCPASYNARMAENSGDKQITVLVADWSNSNALVRDPAKSAFEWRKLKVAFNNIKDAKAAASNLLDLHPEFVRVKKFVDN